MRNGVVDPQPVAGAPTARGQGLSGMDLALHPDFDRNRYVYISYTKPLDEKRTTLAVARAVWDGKALTGTTDVFVGEGGGGGPIAFGGDGMLYIASGGGGGGENATQNREHARRQDPAAHRYRRRADGQSVRRAQPTRDPRSSRWATATRCAWPSIPAPAPSGRSRMGPNGGDEMNILVPGGNYGWPLVSLGRTYAGPWQGPFSKEGFRDAAVLWVPSIAASSIAFYTGDRLPKWKGDVFVGGMRYGEIPGTGQLAPDSDQQEPRGTAAGAAAGRSAAADSRREAGTGRPVVPAHRRGRRGDAPDRAGGVKRGLELVLGLVVLGRKLYSAEFRLRHGGDSGIVRVSRVSGCVAHDFSARSA